MCAPGTIPPTWAAAGAPIWLDPTSTLYYYRYSGSRIPSINREWIEALMLSANSAGGLVLIIEPEPSARAPRKHAASSARRERLRERAENGRRWLR
ncbi:DUF7882 family protein [Cryobacterium aureum]|uniref:DUF7882 family protein n=1 Tax=Cryobacterium aureum TaxID=995037 RepID=UPI003F6B3459